MTFDPEEGARISSALIKAITGAKVMADAGDVGPGLRDVVRHARDLYELLLEPLMAAGHAPPITAGEMPASGHFQTITVPGQISRKRPFVAAAQGSP